MSKKDERLSTNINRRFIINSDTQFVIQEAYKTARTNLVFALSPYEKKIVVITSCSPTEGKSTTCVNMAISLAEKGDNVLVIDGDLRRPTIHGLLKLPNKVGLSSILAGFSNDMNEAINSNVRPNLDVISAGPIPPNPAELLASARMKSLFDLLTQYYDYILIDTPPINVVSDSQLLNEYIAGIMFVIREGKTTHPAIRDAMQSVKMANGRVLGVIKTGCNSRGKKSYKRYKYDYKYGYKHEQGDKEAETK